MVHAKRTIVSVDFPPGCLCGSRRSGFQVRAAGAIYAHCVVPSARQTPARPTPAGAHRWRGPSLTSAWPASPGPSSCARGRIHRHLPPGSRDQFARQIRVRNIHIDAACGRRGQLPAVKETRVRAHLPREASAALLDLRHHRFQRMMVVRLLGHALRHNQMILAHRDIRRVPSTNPCLCRRNRLSGSVADCRGTPALRNRRNYWGISSSRCRQPDCAWVRLASCACSRSHCCCHCRICRRIRVRSCRSFCSVRMRSREALAATRVESIATCPSRAQPCRRAHSTTCVNTSLMARGCPRRNAFSVQ
jgi:hypothetical protein